MSARDTARPLQAKGLRSRLGGRDDALYVTCFLLFTQPQKWQIAEHLMAHYFCRSKKGCGIIAVVSSISGCAK